MKSFDQNNRIEIIRGNKSFDLPLKKKPTKDKKHIHFTATQSDPVEGRFELDLEFEKGTKENSLQGHYELSFPHSEDETLKGESFAQYQEETSEWKLFIPTNRFLWRIYHQ